MGSSMVFHMLFVLIIANTLWRPNTAETTTASTPQSTLDNMTEMSPVSTTVLPSTTTASRKPSTCESLLCEITPGHFVYNTKFCIRDNTFIRLNNSIGTPFTFTIVTDSSNDNSVTCRPLLTLPPRHELNVTFDHLKLDDDVITSDFTLTFLLYDDNHTKLQFSPPVLTNGTETMTFATGFCMEMKILTPGLVPNITLHYVFWRPVRTLPVVKLSDSAGYVTSPQFNGLNLLYPDSYDAALELHVNDNESILISFTHFNLESKEGSSDCQCDYLTLTVLDGNTGWTKCGIQSIPPQIYHSSIKLFFYTDHSMRETGFKMMFAISSRSQEPEKVSNGLYNCSVPHFHVFKPVFNCNMKTECVHGEDEKDCSNSSDSCGERGIDAITKCYQIVEQDKSKRWYDAKDDCIHYKMNLPTLATEAELRQFKQIVSSVKDLSFVFVGAQLVSRTEALPTAALYKRVWQWIDNRTSFSVDIDTFVFPTKCAGYDLFTSEIVYLDCWNYTNVDIICEYDKVNVTSVETRVTGSQLNISIETRNTYWGVKLVQCPLGHMTRDFLACDPEGQCGVDEFQAFCKLKNHTVHMFVCQRSGATLHYTLVCDHIQHCDDNSDEGFCEYSPCRSDSVKCNNGQCVSVDDLCNGELDCYDGSDEDCQARKGSSFPDNYPLPPAILVMDGLGWYKLYEGPCPPSGFQCKNGYCLLNYLVCNGIADCPGREDEVMCDNYICPGFYRCRGSKQCLHPNQFCDGVFHCPQFDDELLCSTSCPPSCQCQGLAFICRTDFNAHFFIDVRYLDASSSGMTLRNFTNNLYLIYLNLSECRIDTLQNISLPNLRHLDLSRNKLTQISMQVFHHLKNLRVLTLSGNPLSYLMDDDRTGSGSVKMMIQSIDLSFTHIDIFNSSALSCCPNLTALNISWGRLRKIQDTGFQSTPKLENIDVKGSPLQEFPNSLLRDLDYLKVVHTDNFLLCCEAMLPQGFDLNKCQSKQDLFASCEDLLKSNTYRVFLWLFASLSIVGNAGSFVGRLYLSKDDSRFGSFSVFVTNLSIADFLMGVYLAIIGINDLIYKGKYLWHHDQWKHSAVCSTAGFLSFVSSEVSAFMICVITFDRFLVVRFPFSTFHFGQRSALIVGGILWVVGIVLAGVPLLPMLSHWEYYSQTSICIPLPFTNIHLFPGHRYSFSIMIVLNFMLFILIAAGQGFIFWSVRINSMKAMNKSRGSREATIARRLVTVVVSDFLCWFPIGLLGVLAAAGIPIPSELNIAVAIFVFPFNSALNPFLYTFNVLMEKRMGRT